MTNEQEYKKERWVYARPMHRIGDTGSSRDWFKEVNGELIAETAVWDFSKENPLKRDISGQPIGKLRIIR